jgi:DNA-binding CsgD family transcriptional regulator
MKSPPILSPRERQVLPSLINGLTRFEIAEKLGLGPDSIKATTRNLIRKFGHRTIRDAMVDLQEYELVYLQSSHATFNNSVSMHMDVFDRRGHAALTLYVDFTALKHGVKTFTQKFCNFADFHTFSMNGAKVNPKMTYNDGYIYGFTLSKKLKRSEVSFLNLNVDLTHPKSNSEFTTVPYWADEPTGELKLSVTFHNDPLPNNFQLVGRHAHHSRVIDQEITVIDGRTCQVYVPDPQYMWRYFLLWNWPGMSAVNL